jgi:hypothetical protein
MARIRTIKPEFFRHGALFDAERASGFPLRLAYAGLWTAADREGRFRWQPRALKLDCLPYDDCDFSAVLAALAGAGLIVKYESGGEMFGHIPSWTKHQVINQREAQSKIPPPSNQVQVQAQARTETHVRAHGEKEREREGEKESIPEAKASGADAPRDFRAELFDRGLQALARLTGKGPDACRSFVGKCLKAASDDAVTVLGLIEDAERNRVADPSAWISARLKSTGPPAKALTAHQRAQHETKDILDGLENFARGGGDGGAANTRLLPDHSGERPQGLRGGIGQDVIDLPRASYRAGG